VKTESKPPLRQTARQGTSETLSEEEKSLLDEGERALKKGNLEEALEIANRSFRKRPTGAGYSLAVRAYCAKEYREDANAKWREWHSKVRNPSREQRAQAHLFCDKHGIQLKL
jgi:hypothetical protein